MRFRNKPAGSKCRECSAPRSPAREFRFSVTEIGRRQHGRITRREFAKIRAHVRRSRHLKDVRAARQGNLIWRARFSSTLKKGYFVVFSQKGSVLPHDAVLFSFR
jgi:hypothetical protein